MVSKGIIVKFIYDFFYYWSVKLEKKKIRISIVWYVGIPEYRIPYRKGYMNGEGAGLKPLLFF